MCKGWRAYHRRVRRRILGVAVSAALVAIVLFAAPLALAVRLIFVTNERTELERAALRVEAVVQKAANAGERPVLPPAESEMLLGLYDGSGRLIAGRGPQHEDRAVHAARIGGGASQIDDRSDMVVAVAVSDGQVVRAATPKSVVWRRTAAAWGAMLGLAALAMVLALAVASRLARRLSRPLESLAAAAQTLGEGDFHVRAELSGVPEIDQSAAALNHTASRLGAMVEQERAFAANASHQLRTPLTGLRLRLESALVDPTADLNQAARDAIVSADRLETTIDELLRLSRGDLPEARTWEFPEVLDPLEERWREPCEAAGRPLRVTVDDAAPAVVASPQALAHALDVLVDNALRHGSGRIDVVARESGDAAAIDVRDEGHGLDGTSEDLFRRGVSSDGGPGIGLALARQLVQSQGGRLLLTKTTPGTVFTVLLPASPETGSHDGDHDAPSPVTLR
jgi:signal transduction histidine kinase